MPTRGPSDGYRRWRQRLRAAPVAAHASLDARASTLDLGQLDDYRRFLRGNAAAVLAAESLRERAGVTDCFADWPARSRRELILTDLRGFGTSTEALAWKRAMPTRAEIFGMVYVPEGSRLGASDAVAARASEEQCRCAGQLPLFERAATDAMACVPRAARLCRRGRG